MTQRHLVYASTASAERATEQSWVAPYRIRGAQKRSAPTASLPEPVQQILAQAPSGLHLIIPLVVDADLGLLHPRPGVVQRASILGYRKLPHSDR